MYKFYFNDCLPQNKSKYEIISCFLKTLSEYKTIKTKYASEIDGIVTSKLAEQMILNENDFTLKNCIEEIPNEKKELKRYAFAIFKKYPIDEHFNIKNENDLVESNYFFIIDKVKHEALNLKIVQENEGVLFSLALHDDLRQDSLRINNKNCDEDTIPNLFGEASNTDFIDKKISKLIVSKSENLEKLLSIIGDNSFSKKFKDGFHKTSVTIQNAIINHFKKARDRNGISPFYSDKRLIKDVTPEKEREIKVFELRIFDPVAYRIYFYESSNKVYLALVEKKPNDKVQSTHIKTTVSIIKELIASKH